MMKAMPLSTHWQMTSKLGIERSTEVLQRRTNSDLYHKFHKRYKNKKGEHTPVKIRKWRTSEP
jgi:hypothetical protein